MGHLSDAETSALIQNLAKWMAMSRLKHSGVRRAPSKKAEAAQEAIASQILSQARSTGTIRIFRVKGAPLAVLLTMKAKKPRVRGESVIFFEYDPRKRHQAIPWLKRTLKEVAGKVPRNVRIGVSLADDVDFGLLLRRLGFGIRYDVLFGRTDLALMTLVKKKAPPLGSWAHSRMSHRREARGQEDSRSACILRSKVWASARRVTSCCRRVSRRDLSASH
ncbi:MAG: hypothetical protein NDJ89_13345 [Oligoflexia bacterium]|nr:hypothetical protein [Oligoflexia bacterium]